MATHLIHTPPPPPLSSSFRPILSSQHIPNHSTFHGLSLKVTRQSFPLSVASKKQQSLAVTATADATHKVAVNDIFATTSTVEEDLVTLTGEDDGCYDLGFATGFEEEESACVAAVPKKRTSRSKKRIRKNVWKRKAYFAALKALSLAKSLYTGKSKSFLSDKLKNE